MRCFSSLSGQQAVTIATGVYEMQGHDTGRVVQSVYRNLILVFQSL